MTSKSPTKVVKFSLRPIQEIHIDSAPTLSLTIFCIYLQNFVGLQPLTNYITMFMSNNIVSAMRAVAAAAAVLLFISACTKTEEPVPVQDDGLIELAFTKSG